jgi:iron(II)-dependent oxidoreductase
MRHNAFPDGVTRDGLIGWYRRTRARTRQIFDLVHPDAYYDRPIALRNPIVFYEGHLPAFSVNTLAKLALKRGGVDPDLEVLFARGIDPETEAAVKSPTDVWPSRERVQAYAASADALIEEVLANAPLEDDSVPELRGGEAVFTILEHEVMHQETLLYMLHNLPYEKKVKSDLFAARADRQKLIASERVRVPAGEVLLGAARGGAFGWDNEFPQLMAHVDDFMIDNHKVTNSQYLEFIDATDANAPHFWIRDEGRWMWRGLLEPKPLNPDAPVFVTHEEASGYARWRGGRLPTEAEYHRTAFGTPDDGERLHPWGSALPDETHGHFNFADSEPVATGAHPAGASTWGVHDLIGNGWEWTSSLFEGFAGFEAMPSYPEYSADFFDRSHYVLKGASQVTGRELIRRPFRNWFRPNYPYVYAAFRCVYDAR